MTGPEEVELAVAAVGDSNDADELRAALAFVHDQYKWMYHCFMVATEPSRVPSVWDSVV